MTNERFQDLLTSMRSKRVSIVGDFILDEYLIGDTKRVSREAPVIVIDYRECTYHPGGAANAGQNAAVLGGAVRAFGVIGNDHHGEILRRVLTERGVDADGLRAVEGHATAVKTRIMAGDLHAQKQQIVRIDRSQRFLRDDESVLRLAEDIERICDGCDALLISDYGMGVVPGPLSAALIDLCSKAGIPVVVDSRFRLHEFRGATVATPNEVELVDALEVRNRERFDVAALARRFIVEGGVRSVIVTRGSRGMLADDGERSERVGIVGSRDVTDVTGAGDTVAAAVALGLASGASLVEAAELATYAASVVVMKRGTATVTHDEMNAVRREHPQPSEVGENAS